MDTQQLATIVTTVSDSQMISGSPGEWSLVPFQLAMAAERKGRMIAAAAAGPRAGAAAAAPALAPAISAGDAALAQAAVIRSNAAAETTPAAAGGNTVSSNTPQTVIQTILQDLNVVGEIGADISRMEAGGKATLSWWGWELDLNEDATQAFNHLLTTDMKDLAVVAGALAAISPVLAAISGVISIVSGLLSAQVSAGDTNANGVIVKGYLWIGIAVSAA